MSAHFQPGDLVVYRIQKSSLHPGPRARDVFPASSGDFYSYSVDKFWRVVAVQDGNKLVALTRRGKQRTLAADDPSLRRAHWWERLLFRNRFPPCVPAEQS